MIVWLTVFILCVSATSEATEEISFRLLEGWPNSAGQVSQKVGKFSHQKVRIRGFIFKSDSGEWILAAEPNLKSCCVGSRERANQQIVILGEVGEIGMSGQVIDVEGTLVIDPIKDSDGRWRRIYTLNEAVVIQEVSRDSPLVPLLILISLFGIGWVSMEKMQRRK